MDYRGLVRGFFIGLLYFVFGKLGMALALPPGFSTAIFPSSGIALVGLALWGLPAGIGVWLGSFILNLTLFGGFENLESFSAPALVATGALVQAYVGANLVGKFHKKAFDFGSLVYIGKYVFLGGMLSSLFNSSWSIFILFSLGHVPGDYVLINWVHWYVGDLVGVISAGPIFWIFVTDTYGISLKEKLKSAFPVFISFVLFLSVFIYSSKKEEESAYQVFVSKMISISEGIEHELQSLQDGMESMRGLYYSSVSVERDEFESFSSFVKEKNPSVISVQWVPRVGQDIKQEFEVKTRKENPYFTGVFSVNKEGHSLFQVEKNNYFPVTYVYPVVENRDVVGYDLFSASESMDAIVGAYETGKPIATKMYPISFSPRLKGGLNIFIPVYKDNYKASLEHESFDELEGLVGFNISWHELIRIHVESKEVEQVEVFFSENSNDEKLEKVYLKQGAWRNIDETYFYEKTFVRFGREWMMKVESPKTYYFSQVQQSSWYILLYGMLFSSILGIFSLYVIGQSKKMASLNEEIEHRLEAEKIMQLKSARHIAAGELAGGIAHEINNPLAIISALTQRTLKRIEMDSMDVTDLVKDLNKVTESVKKVSSIIGSLRRIAREDPDATSAVSSIRSSFEDVLVLVKQKFSNHDVDINESEVPDLYVKVSPVILNQVLLGILNVSYRNVKDKKGSWIDLKWEVQKDKLSLRVIDSGLAMEEEKSEELFEDQIKPESEYDETALGIYISKEVISEWGGDLYYENYRGKSSFVLVLLLDNELNEKVS